MIAMLPPSDYPPEALLTASQHLDSSKTLPGLLPCSWHYSGLIQAFRTVLMLSEDRESVK